MIINTRLQRYIMLTVLQMTALSTLLVLGLDLLFAFIHELGATGQGNYSAVDALFYTLLKIPRRLYDIFPMASLLGVLMGLGLLATHSELIAMRAGGMSIRRIGMALLKVGLGMAIVVSVMGDWLVPWMSEVGESMKLQARSEGKAVQTARGIWVREGEDFIHIRTLLPGGRLQGITRYSFDETDVLQKTTFVERGRYNGKTWDMQGVHESTLLPQQVTTLEKPQDTWKRFIDPSLLQVLLTEPRDLSLRALIQYEHYLRSNDLSAQDVQLLFWKKILQPFSTVVMVLLGVPVIFGPLRAVSQGLRLLTGILAGFTFFVLNEIFGPLSLVYAFPPVLAALAPTVLFAGIGYYFMRHIR